MPQIDITYILRLFVTVFFFIILNYNLIFFYMLQPIFFIEKMYIKIKKLCKNQLSLLKILC
jgi:hypothetical protein